MQPGPSSKLLVEKFPSEGWACLSDPRWGTSHLTLRPPPRMALL